MKYTLVYEDGTKATLDHVRMIALAGPRAVIVATFGNDAVVHRNVIRFYMEPFEF